MVKDAQSEDEIVFLGLESFHDLLQGAVLKRCVKLGCSLASTLHTLIFKSRKSTPCTRCPSAARLREKNP